MSQTKKIDDKIFTKYFTFSKKVLAEESAKISRRLGNFARVIREKDGYTVYTKGVRVCDISKRMESTMCSQR